MKKMFILITLFSLSSLSFGENAELKKAIADHVKMDAGLTKDYTDKMNEAFDFLDPEDPRRINAVDIANLGDWSLSLWVPSRSFRYGQGDYTFCDDPKETASYDMGTVLAGFDTSYKREQTYGFWGVFSYKTDTCDVCVDETCSETKVTRSRTDIKFTKWVNAEQVDILLY
jgi:hypothetical protein